MLHDCNTYPNGASLTLASPHGAPQRFEVEIEVGPPTRVRVTTEGRDAQFGLPGRSHRDYLDLFAQIAKVFGTRVPLNRQTLIPEGPDIEITPLLTVNIGPGILYGYGDPAVMRWHTGGRAEPWFYLVVTSNDAPDAFPILRSRDLRTWENRGFVFPERRTPAWASVGFDVADYWAPEMHYIAGELRVYFVARHKDTGELCIGVATSTDPERPFTPQPEPILRGNRIDPHVFVEAGGQAYLYWKDDNNGIWPDLLNQLLATNPEYV
ncbi:MAG: family 43 glycosylhydrolase, partial [Acidobacteriaceae bacterium]|nr:family 43 glycosylhydrolase [Acidobacteriaceae bacterium]